MNDALSGYGPITELNATALELYYGSGICSMFIILPDSKTGLPELEKKLSEIDLAQELSKLLHFVESSNQIDIEIPKFKIENKLELNEVLEKMGMKKMFGNSAEFKDLFESKFETKVSTVLQKSFINVDEKGTEAAATTFAESPNGMGTKENLVKFIANHPFLYLVTCRNHVIFMGRVVNPAA